MVVTADQTRNPDGPAELAGSKPHRVNKWLVGIMGSAIGFALSQWIASYQFSLNLKTTKSIEMVTLARELNKEFYSERDGEPIYRKIRMAIEACKPLYASTGGPFSNDEINRYLGFFDDIGFFYERGALDEDVINQMFGAYIVEAYGFAELKQYVRDMQQIAHQPSSFIQFQALAQKLSRRPDQAESARLYAENCYPENKHAAK